ncbi:MAG: cytochrome c oxidase subunit II [Frankiaceae bacterium]
MTLIRPAGERPAARSRPRSRAGTALRRGALGLLLLVGATGCSADWIPNFGFPNPITDQGEWVLTLWKGSALAGLGIGAVVWGLILWCIVAYRKRSESLPRQVRYNLPIEVLYTVLPLIVIAVLFYYTAIVEYREDKLSARPDLTVGVVGFQWNWQFNYVGKSVQVSGRPGEPAKLVLPVGERIRFVESSPDVIHSFWVPAFLFKRDVIPGRDNQFELTIRRTGTYIGRCAELCGVDHDRMDFFLQVLPRDQFDNWLAGARSRGAQSGQAIGAGDPSGAPQALGAGASTASTGNTASTATGGRVLALAEPARSPVITRSAS